MSNLIIQNRAELQKAARALTAAKPATPSAFLTAAFNLILPFLPLLLEHFAAKIAKKPKLVEIIRKANTVIDGILKGVDGEEADDQV